MSASGYPDARFAVVERSILVGKIDTLGIALDIGAAALRERAGAGRELGRDGSIGGDPVGESILAVLNDGLGSLVSIISSTGLTWGDWGVIYELQKVLAVTSNDGELLAVLTESIKLVGIGSL